MCATTLRQISVKAGITKLEHNLYHLGVEKKEIDWTDLPEMAGGVHIGAAVGSCQAL